MKNFYELLATELTISLDMLIAGHDNNIEITINNHSHCAHQTAQGLAVWAALPLLEPIDICVYHRAAHVSSLLFDGWQARPHWGQQYFDHWQFSTNNQPFYLWKHHATGQGWLLSP